MKAFIHCAKVGGYIGILDQIVDSIPSGFQIIVCCVGDGETPISHHYMTLDTGLDLAEYELPTLDVLINYAKQTEEDEILLYAHTKGVVSQQHIWRKNMLHYVRNAPLQYFADSDFNCMGAYYYDAPHYRHFGGNFFFIKSSYAKKLENPKNILEKWLLPNSNNAIFAKTFLNDKRYIAEFFYGQHPDFKPLALSTTRAVVQDANIKLEIPMNRTNVLNALIASRKYETYLELGYGYGVNYNNINCPHKVCVDVKVKHPDVFTSDSIAFLKACIEVGQTFDVIFIDDFHEAEHVYEEYQLALQCLNEYGVILFHDVAPEKVWLSRPYSEFREGQLWCGDVYKAWMKIRTESEFMTYALNHDFGVGVVDTIYPKETNVDYEIEPVPMSQVDNFFKRIPESIGAVSYDTFLSELC